jgi:predicted P-loop ATPase
MATAGGVGGGRVQTLKSTNNWVLHDSNKVPLDAMGRPAKTNDPATWTSYDLAVKAAARLGIGVGYVFDGTGVCGIDMDDCIDGGELSDMAKKVLDLFKGTYAEYSPSGNGVHILFKSLNAVSKRTKGLEIYTKGRYFTVTRRPLKGRNVHITTYNDLTEFYALFEPSDANTGVDDVKALIARASQSETFRRLFDGDLSGHAGDHSASDLALCNSLAYWADGDIELMDAAFRASGLYRPKWDRKTGDTTYGGMTLAKAVSPNSSALEEWERGLQRDKKGVLYNTLHNVKHILLHDPKLQSLRVNRITGNIEVAELPWRSVTAGTNFWRNADTAQLICYLEAVYRYFSKALVIDAFDKVVDDRGYDPIVEYLESLPSWDGVPRVDSLLIDFFGAEDSEYVRSTTRKTLCAAVARALVPGCKFDYLLTLQGPQGVRKSTFIERLALGYYTDSLSLADLTRDGKSAAEKLQGYWLVEIGELDGMRKTEAETVKAFISRKDDSYREAYGRLVAPHPRRCILIGTTNVDGFLRDVTGNRRFWPVICPQNTRDARDLASTEIAQIWAEAKHRYVEGEALYLTEELEREARFRQTSSLERDERISQLEEYLETLLPEGWYQLSLSERVWHFTVERVEEGVLPRKYVSNIECWMECFGNRRENIKRQDSYDLSRMLIACGWSVETHRRNDSAYGPLRSRHRERPI